MAQTTRVKGNVLPLFTLSNLTGSPSSVNPSDDLISVNLGEGDVDAVTFSDFSTGNASFAFEIEATYSEDANSFHDVLWRNSGKTGVTFVYGRQGNAVASAGKAVYTGTCTLPPKTGWEASGSESDPDTFTVTIAVDTITRTTV